MLSFWLLVPAVVMSGTSNATVADVQAVPTRERRPERCADAEQPCAVESSKRAASQRWRADVLNATLPAGGKNAGRKKHKFPSFFAPTQELAEAKRDKALDDWLYAPLRGRKVATTEASGSCSKPVDESEGPVAKRPKRDKAPSALGTLKEQAVVQTSRPGQRGAGTGCARSPRTAQLSPAPAPARTRTRRACCTARAQAPARARHPPSPSPGAAGAATRMRPPPTRCRSSWHDLRS